MGEWFKTGDNTATLKYAITLAGYGAKSDPDYDYSVYPYGGRYWIVRRLSANQQVMMWEYAR